MDTVGEGEGGTNWENSMETYITICKIDSKWNCCVTQETQSSALWQPRRVGDGREVQEGSCI